MDKMQEITEYINTMKIKKSFFGGFDREDVYVKLGVITGMFQKYIEEFQKSEEKQKEEYEQRLKASEKNIAQLQQRVGVLLSEKQSVLQEKETALAEKATAIEAMDAALEENETEKELLKKLWLAIDGRDKIYNEHHNDELNLLGSLYGDYGRWPTEFDDLDKGNVNKNSSIRMCTFEGKEGNDTVTTTLKLVE